MARKDRADKIPDEPREISQYDVIMAYKQLFSTPEGEVVKFDLVRRFGYTRQSTLNHDPLRMAWNEGQRSVAVHIGRMIDADPAEIDETRQPTGEL